MDFNTGNKTFREIMGNGLRYHVPRFQRDYAWTQDQWLDLWEDILASVKPGADGHYMGYLVLQRSSDGQSFAIIDGQQRLATLSLLILGALYELNQLTPEAAANQNVERSQVIRRSYIDTADPVSLRTEPKLRLNRNNERYFATLTRLGEPPTRRIRATERQLGKACTFFRGQISKRNLDGAAIADLIERMANQLFFTTITVSNELDAYRVFETLNARGVKLSTPDLLKNYIFSLLDQQQLHDDDLDRLDERWGQIGHQLGSIDFTRFVLTDWNRRNPPARKTELFRQIRGSITAHQDADRYLKQLESGSEIYAALHDADDEYWRDDDRSVREQLRALTLFQIRQPYGLLITVRREGRPRDFERVLKWIVAFSVRYNVIGGLPHQQQTSLYSKASRAFAERRNLDEVRDLIRDLYPSDDAFQDYFFRHTAATIQTPKRARFLLARLAEKVDSQPIDDEAWSLEHILPRNPDSAWREAYGEHADEDAERLGNMALLPENTNRQIDRDAFADKREVLNESTLKLNHVAPQVWTHDGVNRRQRELARIASQLWRIDFH